MPEIKSDFTPLLEKNKREPSITARFLGERSFLINYVRKKIFGSIGRAEKDAVAEDIVQDLFLKIKSRELIPPPPRRFLPPILCHCAYGCVRMPLSYSGDILLKRTFCR